MAYTKQHADDAKLLSEMRDRYVKAGEYWGPIYDRVRDDVKFVSVPGNQWDEKLKARRKNRACYEFPKLRSHVINVQNEMRQSRPQGKVRGTEESDKGLAELLQGICRNIESTSNADRAYDIAYEYAVQGGLGDWRICTDYLHDDDFELDIRVKPVRNPLASKPDPAAVEIDLRDARYWFLEDTIPKSEFERNYPNASLKDFESDRHCQQHWKDRDNVRICEYLYKVPMKRELWALSDGRVVFADDLAKQADLKVAEVEEFLAAAQVEITRRREVEGHKVYSRLTNGCEWLTEAVEIPCKFIPVVRIWGNIQNVDGEDEISGLVAFGKDQQRLHNLHRTAMIEAIAKAPKAPYMITAEQIEGYEEHWKNANVEDYPFLPYKHIQGQNPPARTQQAEVPAALIQAAAMDNDDIKAATGQYDASLGARSNETSGKAINSRKQQGATATFNFIDNLAYGIRYTYEILGDMIPRVYDTPRVVRVLGEDGGEKWKQLYQEVEDETGRKIVLNDISKGKYDYAVTVGPSYATQRMEAADAFANMAGQIGGAAPMIGPLLAYATLQNQDLPGMEEITTALRKSLVAQGLLPPKEGEQPPAPPPPDPRAEAQARKMAADANKAEAEAAKTAGEARMQPAELQKLIAETVAQQLANLQAGGQMVQQLAPQPMQNGYRYQPDWQGSFSMQPEQPPQGGFFSPDGFDQGTQFTG